MNTLGNALRINRQVELALSVFQAQLPILQRLGPRWFGQTLNAKSNIASCLDDMGRNEEALSMYREVYQHKSRLQGLTHENTVVCVCNMANTLGKLGRFQEWAQTIRRHVGPAQKELGADHDVVLLLQQHLALSSAHAATSRKEQNEALSSLQAVYERRLRVFGAAHPNTIVCAKQLAKMREVFAGV